MKHTGIRTALTVLFAGLVWSMLFQACKKDDNESSGSGSGSGYMQVAMTDTPGDYRHVYIDLKRVEVHRTDTNDEGGWVVLTTRDTIYDLLTLQNNVTAVLGDSTKLPAGRITQMRLILGANNSVVLNDNTSYPLTIPSSMNTGIKINLNSDIQANRCTHVLLDFDAGHSVNVLGNGRYQMKPVIQVKSVVVR